MSQISKLNELRAGLRASEANPASTEEGRVARLRLTIPMEAEAMGIMRSPSYAFEMRELQKAENAGLGKLPAGVSEAKELDTYLRLKASNQTTSASLFWSANAPTLREQTERRLQELSALESPDPAAA
jgi:hypothetical protein